MKREAQLGKWLVKCDVCGFVKYNDELIPGIDRQKGLLVCAEDYDGAQAQDKTPYIRPDKPVPFTRPETYETTFYHTPLTSEPDYFEPPDNPND